MKQQLITSEMAAAFHHCERRAYLMLVGGQETGENLYSAMLVETRCRCEKELSNFVQQQYPQAIPYDPQLLRSGSTPLLDANLVANDSLSATANALVPARKLTVGAPDFFEAVIATPHRLVVPEEKIRLGFVSNVLATQQGATPRAGSIFTPDGKLHRIKLESQYPVVRKIISALTRWQDASDRDEPAVILNRHCPECPFQTRCREIALRDDNLTLLRGLTPKKLQQYHKKGIFTVTQLSYQFRPRKSRSRGRKHPIHKPELQALALRTGKTFVFEMPKLSRSDTEIFLDFEGVPDQKFYYLAGLLVVSRDETTPYSFWADTSEQEADVWKSMLEIVERHPEAPIFHYGQYDARACKILAGRYGGDLTERFVNVLSTVYAKVYFPTYGNGLKEIATHLGFEWPAPLDSGLKSLVWRRRWESDRNAETKQQILEYNLQDCRALRVVTDRLADLSELVETDPSLELADRPKKQATNAGEDLHSDFETILLLGHAKYAKKRITFSKKNAPEPPEGATPRKRRTNLLKPTKTVLVAPRRKCPKCKNPDVQIRSNRLGKAIVADLIFTKNGLRKSVTLYVGPMIHCRRCDRMFRPKRVCDIYHGKRYGDGLLAYAAYQRIVLRIPLRTITTSINELFGLEFPSSTPNLFIKRLASSHASTERRIMKRILVAPCIHFDETMVNVQGENHYVWVMTDGEHVVFKSTPTREADWVKVALADYSGILVSDFYAGYDSVDCRQQKCLSHLIRDLNEDLWKEPFNREYERFADSFKAVIVPIMETIQQYGSKKRNLNKHRKEVDSFYRKFIDGMEYSHETTRKYQKRFQRYRDSLFTFLTGDSIPWNNNMAERALRHLAVQRKISGSFGKEGIHRYLLLLGIAQTCRFQKRSFLRFLLSGGRDVDAFDASRRKKN